MAKPKQPLLSFGARGTIAKSLTFQKRGRATIARTKPTPTDPKSEAQLARRQIYRDAVDAWHALTPEEKEAYRGVCPGLTPYQCYMKTALTYVPPVPPPEEQTEEQIQENNTREMYDPGLTRAGQRLFILNREVTKLGFWLHRQGDISGDVTFRIRKVSDDSVILEKVAVDAGAIPTETTYYEVEFDTAIIINEEVRILAEWIGGGYNRRVHFHVQNTEVKENEYLDQYTNTTYAPITTWDAAYRYKYYEVE